MVTQVVVLSANGEKRQSRITGEVSGGAVAKLCRKTKPAELIGEYDYGELTLQVWGWKEGKAGTENKHELPPPLDGGLLFGDAVVAAVATEDEASHNMTVAQWEKFYTEAFKGFEDLGSDSDSDSDSDSEASLESESGDDANDDDGDAEEEDEDSEASEEEGDEEEDEEADEEEEEAEDDDECYDDGEDGGGGGGKRRAPRRRTTAAPEYRRMEMGIRSRVKVPMPVGKRAPRWQTAPELVEESY
jgi:hypothetical protein